MIPAYNQANVLGAAVESALRQDYSNLEVIISDDCSTDGTEERIKKYISDKRLQFFQNPRNLGRVANYKNTLEKWASGDWVVNLDGDDYFTDPAFISKAIQLINQSGPSEVVFLQAGHTVKNPDGKIIRNDVPVIESSYKIIEGKEYFLGFNHFSHLATVFNRQKAIALDFYRYDILSTDIESFLRLSLQGKVILMKESVGVWVHHKGNQSKQLGIAVVEKNMLRFEGPYIYAKALNIFPDYILLKWRNRMTKSYLLHYLSFSMKNGRELNGYLIHIVKFYPQIIFSSVIPRAIWRALKP